MVPSSAVNAAQRFWKDPARIADAAGADDHGHDDDAPPQDREYHHELSVMDGGEWDEVSGA